MRNSFFDLGVVVFTTLSLACSSGNLIVAGLFMVNVGTLAQFAFWSIFDIAIKNRMVNFMIELANHLFQHNLKKKVPTDLSYSAHYWI